MIETLSGPPRNSSVIFRNCPKIIGNVRVIFGQVLENLRKSSESGRIYLREIVKNAVISMSRSLVRYFSFHMNIEFIPSRHGVISSIYVSFCVCLDCGPQCSHEVDHYWPWGNSLLCRNVKSPMDIIKCTPEITEKM